MGLKYTIAILSFCALLFGCRNGNDVPPLPDSESTISDSTSNEGSLLDSQSSGITSTDANSNSIESWLGHWENGSGKLWIVISHDRDFEITVSNGREVTWITHSEDYRHLTFILDNRWTYELTLNAKNDSQIDFSDRDNRDGPDVWGDGTLYKLSRSTKEDSR